MSAPVLLLDAAWRIDRVIDAEHACELLVMHRVVAASAEVATIMRVSKMTVYRLVHNGELPAVRVGRSFRVHAKAVHDMLESSYFDAG